MRSEILEKVEETDKALIAEIERISLYTVEEAEAIWHGCPYYLCAHYLIKEGASINDVAKFILRKLNKN